MGGGFSIPQVVGGIVDGTSSGLAHLGETVASIVMDFLLNFHNDSKHERGQTSLLVPSPPPPVVGVVSPYPTGNNDGRFTGLETAPSEEESMIQYPLGLMSSITDRGDGAFISPSPQVWAVPSCGGKRTRDDEDGDCRDMESTASSTILTTNLPTPKRSGSKETRFVLADTPFVVPKKKPMTVDVPDSSSKLFQPVDIDLPLTLGLESSPTSTAEIPGTSNSNSNSTLADLDSRIANSSHNVFSTGTSSTNAAIHAVARPQTLGRGRKNGRNKSKKGKNKNRWNRK